MTLFIITSFIWIHFLMDYFVDPMYFKSYLTGFKQEIVHSILYTMAFIPFGLYFALANGASHIIFDTFTEYCMRVARSIIPGKQLPYVLKILRGVDQMLHLTMLFVIYFVMKQFDILGPSFF